MAPPKTTSFSVVRKKNRFQRQMEEEELKRKRDAEEAANLLDGFAEHFEAGGGGGGDKKSKKNASNDGVTMNFVSAGVQGAGSRPGAETTTEDGGGGRGKKYVPSFTPPGMAMMKTSSSEQQQQQEHEAAEEDKGLPGDTKEGVEKEKHLSSSSRGNGGDGGGGRRRPTGFSDAPPAPNPPTTSGRRAIDVVMEEMMAKQQERDKARREGREVDVGNNKRKSGGKKEDKDPYSTNLYLGNLPREIDEDQLLSEFAKYGPIASVKVMWPRGDEDVRLKTALTGFVAFMTRSSAEKAKEEMDGKVLHRHDIRVNWGKSVTLPPKPIWPLADDDNDDDDNDDGDRFDHHRRASDRRRGDQGGRSNNTQLVEPAAPDPPPGVPEIKVTFPEDRRVTALIDTLARYVAEDGYVFERAVMDRERETEDFKFLFDADCPEHRYYRWRVFSLAQGDTLGRWRTDPFVMIAGGLRWTPPDPAERPTEPVAPAIVAKKTSGPGGGGTGANEAARLVGSDADAFEDLLRGLTIERCDIEEAMSFALDHAEAAHDVAEILTEALTLSETPVPQKVARLFLVSDILHNCGAPVKNASLYRGAFQEKLPHIFESLEETHKGLSSRITREAFKKRVMAVTAAWADWFLFGEEYLKGLEATFARGGVSANAMTLPDDVSEKLRLEIEAMDPGERERACRVRGLVVDGGPEECAKRLVNLETFLRTTLGGGGEFHM